MIYLRTVKQSQLTNWAAMTDGDSLPMQKSINVMHTTVSLSKLLL